MTELEQDVELVLTRWGERRRESDAIRDGMVRGAIWAGISKHRIHLLTGIARTTIDRIVDVEYRDDEDRKLILTLAEQEGERA